MRHSTEPRPEQYFVSSKSENSIGNIVLKGLSKNGRCQELAEIAEPPDYYYDISTNQLLFGRPALEAYLHAGGHLVNVRDLGHFLRSDEPLMNPRGYRGLDISTWSNQDILDNMRCLISILPPPEKPREKLLNERIIRRANYLGLTPSVRQITYPNRFGSSTNFYQQLGESNTSRKFNRLTPEEAFQYISSLALARGHVPTEEELYQIAKDDPNKPSYEVLRRVLPEGLSGAARELGYVAVKFTNGRGYINWGVEFYVANNLSLPRQDSMRLLSSERKSPGYSTTKRRFKSEKLFQQHILSSYKEDYANFIEGLNFAQVPDQLFNYVTNPSLLLGRALRWDLVDKILPPELKDLKKTIVIADLPDREFLNTLESYDREAKEKVEDLLENYGTLKNMWRIDYIKSLNVEYAIKAKLDKLRSLSRWQKKRMENSIKEVAESLNSDGYTVLKHARIAKLQAQGRISSGAQFEYLFKDEEHFRAIVQSRMNSNSRRENPRLIITRKLARERLRNIYLNTNGYDRLIRGAGVVKERILDNGDVLVELSSATKRVKPVPPGSMEARAIVERVRKELEAIEPKKFTISGSRGVEISRRYHNG